jgi:serine/threonine protein kinase
MLADGGFASVYVGCKLDVDDVPENTPEEAALAGADVAVKVYHTNVPNSTTEQLQAYANNEQMALSLLQNIDSPWGTTVVKLLATAELDPAVAVAASTPISSAASSGQQNQRSCHVDSSSDGSNATSNTNNQASYLQRCLVLEYLPRGAVSKISKKCPEESAKALLWPLLRTLMVMHSGELGCRIIHRDIKPDNLLLRQVESGPQRGFQLVLAEFGCCFIEPPGLNHPFIAGMHTCVGSTLYQAPEVAEGGCCLGSSIDTYSLGVTLMQLLGHLGSGCQNPKQGTTVQDVRQQLEEFVDGPADETASAAVREFVGCCCGVGRIRAVAAARGDAARMTAEQLFETTWMRYDRQQDEDDDVSELMGGGFTDDEQDYGDDDNNFSGAGGEAAGGGSAGAAGECFKYSPAGQNVTRWR